MKTTLKKVLGFALVMSPVLAALVALAVQHGAWAIAQFMLVCAAFGALMVWGMEMVEGADEAALEEKRDA